MSKFSNARRGFTLLEVLIAILLIDVGLLALVAGSAVLVRQTNNVRLRAAAYRAASNRIESLGVSACADASGQALAADGSVEHWSERLVAPSVRELRDSVVFELSGSTHAVLLATRRPC